MRVLLKRIAAMTCSMMLATSAMAADKDIVDTAVEAGKFKTLAAALQAADLVGALKGEGPFTVFAPTDDAFAKLPEGTVEGLLKPESESALKSVLTYHVVSGKVMAADVVKLSGAKTLNGQRVSIQVSDAGVMVDGAKVTTTDIECSNGVIHIIDSVILPSSQTIPEVAADAGSFSTLLAAVKAAGLAEVLSGEGPFTVFAPTDEAFAKLPEGTVASLLEPANKQKLVDILKYHVVAGRVFSEDALAAKQAKTLEGSSIAISVTDGGAKVNEAGLVKTDINAANGVIHIIDSVLLPPAKTSDVRPAGPLDVVQARRMIESTIAQGSHLFNSGHHAACAEMYQQSLTHLVHTGVQGVSSCTASQMSQTVAAASAETNPTRKAWMLRHSMDQMYGQLVATSH